MSVRKVDIAQATEPLARYAQSADEGPLVVTEDGQPIAVVIGVENADLETVAMATTPSSSRSSSALVLGRRETEASPATRCAVSSRRSCSLCLTHPFVPAPRI